MTGSYQGRKLWPPFFAVAQLSWRAARKTLLSLVDSLEELEKKPLKFNAALEILRSLYIDDRMIIHLDDESLPDIDSLGGRF
ncbi:hypothetical protein AAE478_008912 [Parahypoxylon ruwenzoriense]